MGFLRRRTRGVSSPAPCSPADLDLLAAGTRRLCESEEPNEVADQLCATACDLLRAPAAGFYVDQHTRFVELGRSGLRAVITDPAIFHDRLRLAAETAEVTPGPPVLARVADKARTIGVLAVTAPERRLDAAALSALQALLNHAADAFYRVGLRSPVFAYPHDPDSLVFEPVAVPAVVATLEPGDVVVTVVPRFGAGSADRLGGQLARMSRPFRDLVVRCDDDSFVMVVRASEAVIDALSTRVVRHTQGPDGGASVTVGAATHRLGDSPLDTLHAAWRASRAD